MQQIGHQSATFKPGEYTELLLTLPNNLQTNLLISNCSHLVYTMNENLVRTQIVTEFPSSGEENSVTIVFFHDSIS